MYPTIRFLYSIDDLNIVILLHKRTRSEEIWSLNRIFWPIMMLIFTTTTHYDWIYLIYFIFL